jgi:hypothetical protein
MTDSLKASDDLAAKGATAPRVTLQDIEDNIAAISYINAGQVVNGEAEDRDASPLDLLTVCFITTQNGFVVVGKSAPASAENFDEQKGRQFARDDAIRQLWPLMAYSLKQDIMNGWADF